jgi:hypothetical protein
MKKSAAVFKVITYAAVALREMNAEKKIMTSKDHHSKQSMPVDGIPSLKKSMRPALSKQADLTSGMKGWNQDLSFSSGVRVLEVYMYMATKVIKWVNVVAMPTPVAPYSKMSTRI